VRGVSGKMGGESNLKKNGQEMGKEKKEGRAHRVVCHGLQDKPLSGTSGKKRT